MPNRFSVPCDADPSFDLLPLRINPRDKYQRNKGLNPKEDSEFRGICSIYAEQIIACYGIYDDYFSADDFRKMCRRCPYRSTRRDKSFDPFYQSIFDAFYVDKCLDDITDIDDPKSFVYFITDGQYVKIGKAKNPRARLGDLQVGNAKRLSILYLIPCKSEAKSHKAEQWFHALYHNYRKEGEWSDIADKLNTDSWGVLFSDMSYLNDAKTIRGDNVA